MDFSRFRLHRKRITFTASAFSFSNPVPNPSKPVEGPKSYRTISLLCVLCKILERLICNRVESIVHPLLSKEQTGFPHGKSTVDQVVLLTQNIKNSFEAKKRQLLMTLSGTVASSASCRDFCRTSTCSG